MRAAHAWLLAVGAYLCLAGCAPALRPSVASVTPLAAPSPSEPSRGLSVRYFGTSTVVITDGSTAIITDGFFSRPRLGTALFQPLRPHLARIESGLRHAGANRAAAVLVAHAHHDHAMDAPYVAQLTSARLVGSRSAGNIARGVDFPDERIDEIADGSRCQFGAFTVTALTTPHSRPVLFPGRITAPLGRTARIGDYREGGNFSFHVAHPWGDVLIVPSRGVRKDRHPLKADVVLLSVGGWVSNKRSLAPYWAQFVDGPGAQRIYPIHWDNFFRPFEYGPASESDRRINRKLGYLRALARPGQEVRLLPFGDEVLLYGPGADLVERARTQDGCSDGAGSPSQSVQN